LENFAFIESSIIFGLNPDTLKKFHYNDSAFEVYPKVFSFITKYIDQNNNFPTAQILIQEYSELNQGAIGVDWEYAYEQFVKYRTRKGLVGAIEKHSSLLETNPRDFIHKVVPLLQQIDVQADDDVEPYELSTKTRLSQYKERIANRGKADGYPKGILTPFESINSSGVGWDEDMLISLFARPSIGKTWITLKVASTAFLAGYKVLFISAEMPTKAINMRLDVINGHSLGYDFTHSALRSGDGDATDQYHQFLDEIETYDNSLFVSDHIQGANSITVGAIENLIRIHKPDICVVDGIYMIDLDGASNARAMWEANHQLFQRFKNAAKNNNIPIFVSTQSNRDEKTLYEPPSSFSVAFGDALIRFSDVALSMSGVMDAEEVVHHDKRRIRIAKMRDQQIFTEDMYMSFDVDNGSIEEVNFDPFTKY